MRFVIVYQREPHARQMAFDDVPQPATYEERVALARKTIAEHELVADVWVDDMGDASRAAFGDLPHAAIVIDPTGTVQLKLSWCDPQVLERTLPEIKAMVVVPGAHQAPAETSFLETITAKPTEGADNLAAPHDPAIERHHRHTMLAYLVTTQSEHADRKRWLEELSTSGPPQQRAWAAQWLRAASSGQSDQEPPPDAGRGTVRQKK